jgi:hypothetical protein
MLGPTGKGLWLGAEGTSAFTQPFIDYSLGLNRLPGFLERIHRTDDDRSFVIVSAVVVERYLDALLESVAPGYDHLIEKKNSRFR